MATGENPEDLLQLDLDGILRARLGKKARWLPRVATRLLENIICQNRLNELLRLAYPHKGSTFAAAVLRELGITVSVEGLDNIPEGRHVFVSNHPLGGLDGIALISVLGAKYSDENIRFLVNDLLMNVIPLLTVFLPINKYGSQARAAAEAIADTYASEKQMLVFPAGLVSRRQRGEIADLKWQKAFVVQALRHRRDIVPVYFDGLNRPRFYNLAHWRKKLGIKVNLEQALLPSELCAAQGNHFRIIFGDPISAERLESLGKTHSQRADAVRTRVYALRHHPA